MEDITKPASFGRYSEAKYNRFRLWMDTPHGQAIYSMFKKFSTDYKSVGHEKTGANLIGNRVRWEVSIGAEYTGYKVNNDFLPMMARALVHDDPSFDGFFNFHDDPDIIDPELDFDDAA